MNSPKAQALRKHEYFVGDRNPKVKPEFSGKFMVNDPTDPDGYAIVGDDFIELVDEAHHHLLEWRK